MSLNYSKWDQLEVSDDSDIEGHPNVDHKSLVRWKQRDIHEKREKRKQLILQLEGEIACDNVIMPRLAKLADEVAEKGPAHFSATVERLKTSPSPDKPPTTSPTQPTYDAMLEASLAKVWGTLKDKGVGKDDPRLGEKLVKGIHEHLDEFRVHHEKIKVQLETERAEQKKKITSDDIHQGFESKYVPAKPAPPPLTRVEYEVLNPEGVAAGSSTGKPPASADATDEELDEDRDEEDDLPDMTPELKEFAKLKVKDYENIYRFIQQHRSVVVPGASDALLVEAFSAESRNDTTYARQCVHQSLVLQYCEKLGKDGVRVFFTRMLASDPRAEQVFAKDFAETYEHMSTRAAVVREEERAAAKEQIQLVAADAGAGGVSFNVPDGPPPADLRLEGPGTAELDIEEVRAALQMRWEVFSGFAPPLQGALRSGSLERVNKVLAKMSVEEAEGVVQGLQLAGILSFADEGRVRDAEDMPPKAA